MIRTITTSTPFEKKPFGEFKNSQKVKRAYISYRYHNTEKADNRTKIQSLAGAVLGTVAAMVLLAKGQHIHHLINPINLFKIKYGLKEMAVMSGLSVIGGVLGGMIGSNKKKEKINEGIFQFINAALPPLMVVPVIKGVESVKSLNNTPVKIGATLVTLFAGMKAGTIITNTIIDPYDKVPDRKLTLTDAIANADDGLGALAVTKIPGMHIIEKTLPFVYTWCGYRAGQSN